MERKKARKSRVRILGRWIKILYIEDLKADGEKVWGICDDDELTISIEATASDDMYQRTLEHEKMHMRLRLSGLIEMMSDELDEALARLMEMKD